MGCGGKNSADCLVDVNAAWCDGFLAASYLFAGYRDGYEMLRDAYLERRRRLGQARPDGVAKAVGGK